MTADSSQPPGLQAIAERITYQQPDSWAGVPTHYCPGCTHGVAHRLVAEVLDELGVAGRTIGVAPVGCAVFAYRYFNVDFAEAAHGRAPAMATGIKRVLPDRVVFTYQGDGDLAAIGAAEILHVAARGENITTIFINNATYGMTGGQMAPTSLPGQKTTSSPFGRDIEMTGMPIQMSELIAGLPGAVYVARRSLHNVKEINKAKKAIRQAFEIQLQGLGFAMVELLSNCPTNWEMTPTQSLEWIETMMIPAFPLGDFKVPNGAKQS
ncbi:MAG TPA: thiamine pyrophosphate-dependent enzyme [Anaerolineales bacterium]|jgi:2-oxoglutarate ferredoxin oxidoreductase subunit beta